MKKKGLQKKTVGEKILVAVPLALFSAMCLLPFIMLISSSLTSNEVLLKGVTIIPKDVTFDGYRIIFTYPLDMLVSYGYTIAVTLGGTVLSIILCLLIAYPLADVEFKHRGWVSFLVYFTVLFSAGLIPTYIVITRLLNLNNTIWILILMPAMAPGHIIFLRVYFQNVPSSLYESAEMDGANHFRILFFIATPLVIPGLATLAFQMVIMYWNDSFTPLYYTDDITPIALYLYRWENYINYLKFAGQGGLSGILGPSADIPDLIMRYAMAVLSSFPLIVIFLFFQKYFVRGLTSGAIKG